MQKTYMIEVDCANCANHMEEAVNKVSGIKSANVNFMAQKILIDFEEGADEKKVLKDAKKAVKKIDSDMEIYI